MYYRLQLIDKGGSFSYSNIITVSIPEIARKMMVYPNPARNIAIIKGSHIASVQVLDNIGRTMSVQTLNDATNPLIRVNSLPAGLSPSHPNNRWQCE